MFIVLIKQTKKYRLFGSLPVLAQNISGTDLKNLTNCFTRKKLKKFENENYLIIKANLERGGKHKSLPEAPETNNDYEQIIISIIKTETFDVSYKLNTGDDNWPIKQKVVFSQAKKKNPELSVNEFISRANTDSFTISLENNKKIKINK